MRRHIVLIWCIATLLVTGCARSEPGGTNSGKVLAIGELTWQEIDALDRDKTIFLLTVGMLEEHGPHLPVAADTIGVEYEAGQVADRLAKGLSDWNIVVMPTVNYASSGVNQVGGIAVHPGTYGIRQSTLRALVADIGGQIAQNRFKWIFVMNGHGAPTGHSAINDACDFVSEAFNATMLNVSGLFSADAVIQTRGRELAAKHFSQADLSSFGNDPHAGVGETSGLLAVRPDLVRPSYHSLPSYRVENRTEMRETASRPGWPGYFSSPARATAAYGRDVEEWWATGMTDLIVEAVRGENLFTRPRWPDPLQADPEYAQFIEYALQPDREFEQRFEHWLETRVHPLAR